MRIKANIKVTSKTVEKSGKSHRETLTASATVGAC